MFKLLKLASAVAVAGAFLIPSAACTLNPTITATNASNECGGVFHINGSGFTANGSVEIEVLGFYQVSGWVDFGPVKADASGTLTNVEEGFNYPQANTAGCAGDAPEDDTVTIMAKDMATGTTTFTTTSVKSCPAVAGSCRA